jgi:nucleoside-diphosphate-sugar epimerase
MEIQVGPVAWVTGATSFLGRHVARQLRRDGFKVVGFSRQQITSTSAAEWGFATIEVGDFAAAMLERVLQRLARGGFSCDRQWFSRTGRRGFCC